jgi:hypothetical protein
MTQLRSLGTKEHFPPPPQRSILKYPICTLEVLWPARNLHGHRDTMACPLFDSIRVFTWLVLNNGKFFDF